MSGGAGPSTSVRVVECRVRCEAHVLRLGGAESEQHPRREGAIAVRVSGVGGKHLLGSKGWGEGEGKGGGKGEGEGRGWGGGKLLERDATSRWLAGYQGG